jgi:hypothetical protein
VLELSPLFFSLEVPVVEYNLYTLTSFRSVFTSRGKTGRSPYSFFHSCIRDDMGIEEIQTAGHDRFDRLLETCVEAKEV